MARRRRPLDIWPAFVDAIASLLMVVVFVLLVAVVGQQFLTDALLGRDRSLARLNARVDQLADLLSMQQAESARLDQELALRSASLASSEQALAAARDLNADQAAQLERRARTIDEQNEALAGQRAELATLEHDIAALQSLKDRINDELEATLAERDDIRARLAEENELNVAAQAEVENLNRQLEEVRRQLASLAETLEVAEQDAAAKDLRIAELGQKLNLALANKASELARYRSDFFGRLREALAGTDGVEVVGDRFVLPAGVLFPSGTDELGPAGRRQVARVAETLTGLMTQIPADIDWILRVDGHTDRRPINTERFPSNWELSTARAIAIVHELVRFGIPPTRLAATGFGPYHPIDNGDSPAALARNRRIEFKLTSR
ncbi:MAG: peptidoglycan -binding protein [Gammaproteobacteria bacterium]|nr:peptidoglycan -binding protein [Gammaproteobacteria bacterium]MCP5201158.1 peptidoglycan -binding protein [Gammaproteobacteria bacterium]